MYLLRVLTFSCQCVCLKRIGKPTPSRWSEHIEPTIFHKIFDSATPWASVSVHQIINITCLLEKVHWRSHVAVPNLKAHDLEISSRYGFNFKGTTSLIFDMFWSFKVFNHPLLGPYFGFISNSPETGLHTSNMEPQSLGVWKVRFQKCLEGSTAPFSASRKSSNFNGCRGRVRRHWNNRKNGRNHQRCGT